MAKKQKKTAKEAEEPELDYAASADAFFGSHEESDRDGNDDDDLSENDERVGDEEASSSEQSVDEQSAEGESESEEEEEEEPTPTNNDIAPPTSATGEPCSFDLRNLLALNTHQIDTTALYSKRKIAESGEKLTIAPESTGVVVNEDYLLRQATDGCTQLVTALWQLPIQRSDAGPMAVLPSYEEVKIPRALPPPPPKQETKWEKFARQRGIGNNNEKRSQKVWDEDTGTWMYRHGYRKANGDKDWPIMEVKATDDPFADPWEKQREAKRARGDKNTESRLRNAERAGNLVKGTTNRVVKSREKTRQTGKAGGDKDKSLPAGVPVDLRANKVSGEVNPLKRGKASTMNALLATQRSTASLGNFDKMREGEPERKKAMAGIRKRKYESAVDKKVLSGESQRSLKVLKSVIEGGGAAKEKAKRKGKLAKGETAYDYDFDDGLGASSFRKKKGRAGAGKMKKMTKKRAK